MIISSFLSVALVALGGTVEHFPSVPILGEAYFNPWYVPGSAQASAATEKGAAGGEQVGPSNNAIPITDDKLNVLVANQVLYKCSSVNLPEWGIEFDECTYRPTGQVVYHWDGIDAATFSPGYSMPKTKQLIVERQFYGTGSKQ